MASINTRRQGRQSKLSKRQRRRQRKVQQRARQQLRRLETQAPSAIRHFVRAFAGVFTRPTYYRFFVLILAALLTTGNHTVLNLLRTLGTLAPGSPSSYHRIFSKRRWSLWQLAYRLTEWIIRHFVGSGPIPLAGDDTVDGHRGKKVFGKGRHRDAVRSSHSYTAFRYGHKWVVLAILVRFPFATRPWALPVLVALYRSPPKDKKQNQRHKTPAQLMRQMLKVLLRWFPDRHFVFAGDGGFGTHELARSAAKRPQRLTLVSRFYADANLYKPPPIVRGKKPKGRPRVKGAKVPAPAQVVAKAKERQRLNVAWYGGGRRDVEVVSGTAHWFKGGEGLVPVLWVFVHDCTGTHRDEYFFTTNVALSAQTVIETFTGRWNIETTFQEMRAYLGLETTRGRCAKTVLRVAPCLFGLYSVVAILYTLMPARYARVSVLDWPGKKDVTFSDAITAVRRWLWQEWVFAIPGHREAFSKLSRPFRSLVLYGLAPAA
jgi:DDE superfamily endonuclease/Archaeal putative transposase ISC1217